MEKRLFSVLAVLILTFLAVPAKNSYAYIDPGTGSYIFQLLMAAIIGGLFAVKIFWAKIVRSVKSLFSKKKP